MPVIRIIRAIAVTGLVALALATAHAWRTADILADAAAILELPWGIVSLLDAYVGFILIGCWIVFRESQLVVGTLWLGAVLLLGNLASCVYVLVASLRARGDLAQFWLGAQAESLRTRQSQMVGAPPPTLDAESE